jgi:hypothetical protein
MPIVAMTATSATETNRPIIPDDLLENWSQHRNRRNKLHATGHWQHIDQHRRGGKKKSHLGTAREDGRVTLGAATSLAQEAARRQPELVTA